MERTFNEIGLDKYMQHIGVLLEKYDASVYPRYELSSGFIFSEYKSGMEEEWSRLQYDVEQVDTLEEGKEEFQKCFKNRYDDMMKRCIFVLNQNNEMVATASMWDGSMFGDVRQRFHWVGVSPKYQGLRISYALVTKMFDIYNELGYSGYIYIASQTWSYKAINIYKKFGFRPYFGEKPEKWIAANLTSKEHEPWDYKEKNIEAWDMINAKIEEYSKI